jgi:beta-glucuronidase
MDQSDSQGIVVIDETPATGMNYFGDSVLKLHMDIFRELYTRDKNRPSVVMWSLANEPNASDKASDDYFKRLVEFSKTLEKSRPISATTYHGYDTCLIAKHLDVLMINRYFGWYTDKGYTRPITQRLVTDLEEWHKVYKKPMILSEYGADTSSGLHDVIDYNLIICFIDSNFSINIRLLLIFILKIFRQKYLWSILKDLIL